MKNQKGITLIALVVTIIVLLILSGVSIAMLTGTDGLISNARETKIANAEGLVREAVVLAISSYRTEQWNTSQESLTISVDNIKSDVEETLGDKYTVGGSGQTLTVTGGDFGSATCTVTFGTNGAINTIDTVE